MLRFLKTDSPKKEGLDNPPPLTSDDLKIADVYRNRTNERSLVNRIRQNEQDVSQKRMITINESNRVRMGMQNDILWRIFYTIAASALLAFVHHNFPSLLGENLYAFLLMLIILLGAMFVYLKYMAYSARNPVDFNEVLLPDPAKAGQTTTEEQKLAALNNGELSNAASLSTCIGKECCTTGTKFDASQGKCVPES